MRFDRSDGVADFGHRYCAKRGRPRTPGRIRAADQRRRVRQSGIAHRTLGRDRFGISGGTEIDGRIGSGVSEAAQRRMESGRARTFQSCGESQRRCSAVRVPGHVHDAHVGAGQGAASAARRSIARVRRRIAPRSTPVFASARATRGRALHLAQGDGGCRRDISPAAMVPARGLSDAARRAAARIGRRRRPRAGHMEGESDRRDPR